MEPRASDQHQRHRAGGPGACPFVLVVDEEPALLALIVRILGRIGCPVVTATSAEAAIELAAAHDGELRLLVTDVELPDTSGRELADLLRATRPQLPLLFTSASAPDVVAGAAVLGEHDHLIAKPFTLDDLLRRVVGILGGSPARCAH